VKAKTSALPVKQRLCRRDIVLLAMMYLTLLNMMFFAHAQNDVAPLRAAMMRCLPSCARRHTSFALKGIHH